MKTKLKFTVGPFKARFVNPTRVGIYRVSHKKLLLPFNVIPNRAYWDGSSWWWLKNGDSSLMFRSLYFGKYPYHFWYGMTKEEHKKALALGC